jgi:tRNA-modifying protein YgfZ
MPVVNIPGRALIRTAGLDAEHFLHNLVTCDIEALKPGELAAGALLSPQGKIMFDFLVSRAGGDFLIECRSEISGELTKRFKFFKLRAKVEISVADQTLVQAGWQSDSETSRTDSAASHADSSFSLIDLRFPAALGVTRSYGTAADGASALGGFTLLRITNGICEGGPDYAYGEAFPHDVNLDQINGVSFSKGCYVGQEVVSRMQHRGTARRRALIATGSALLVSGAEVTSGGRSLGALGSALGPLALALVRMDKVKDARDAGAEILAGGVPIGLALPPRASFGWPEKNGDGT